MNPCPPIGRGLRVLVVDDFPEVTDCLALLLQRWGHQALTTYHGPTALRIALAQRPHAALLDINLQGGMDGYEVARRLRAQPQTATALLVAVTGQLPEEDLCRQAGFDCHLVKPFAPESLRQLLDARCQAIAQHASAHQPV